MLKRSRGGDQKVKRSGHVGVKLNVLAVEFYVTDAVFCWFIFKYFDEKCSDSLNFKN